MPIVNNELSAFQLDIFIPVRLDCKYKNITNNGCCICRNVVLPNCPVKITEKGITITLESNKRIRINHLLPTLAIKAGVENSGVGGVVKERVWDLLFQWFGRGEKITLRTFIL